MTEQTATPDPIGIDLVSPLPPVRSGISDYAVDLLPYLAERCELRVVRLPGQPVADDLVARWRPIDADTMCAAPVEGGYLPLYQMGNNHHHAEVWRLAMERPGVVVLHDLVLHHFLIERTVKEKDFDAYRGQLTADHGWIGDAASLPFRWPGGAGSSAQFALPAHRSLLTSQRGVVVHSRWARDVLAEEIPELAVRVVSMGIPLPPPVDDAAGIAFRRRHGIPDRAPLLGSFGFQTPMKRTEEVIRALGEPELAEAHLMVAGEVAAILELDRVIAESGADGRVHVLGFLDWQDFESAIAACDLALNLRYPTAGETSASLLRILALGRPAVVSDHAQMAELPDEVVVKVPVGEGERRALAERLSELLADRPRLERIGAAARAWIAERHRLEDAADALVAACRELGGLRPPEVEAAAPGPPTSLAWHEMTGEIEVDGAESPWAPGTRRTLTVRLRNDSDATWLAGERLGGGVAIQTKLLVDDSASDAAVESGSPHDLFEGQGWRGLPRDLQPGETHTYELTLRKPLAPEAKLVILPHVLGFTSLADLGGPRWERVI